MKSILDCLNESHSVYSKKMLLEKAGGPTKKGLIFSFLKNKIEQCTIGMNWPDQRKIGGEEVNTYWMIKQVKKTGLIAGLNFKGDDLFSVDFYGVGDIRPLDPFGSSVKSKLSLYTNGGSAVYLLPIIVNICNTENFNLTDEQAERLANKVFEESVEELSEAPDKELRQYRNDKRQQKRAAKAEWQKKRTQKAKKAYRAIADEYKQSK